jgi:tetratricopeptide (TPR) repeat protein
MPSLRRGGRTGELLHVLAIPIEVSLQLRQGDIVASRPCSRYAATESTTPARHPAAINKKASQTTIKGANDMLPQMPLPRLWPAAIAILVAGACSTGLPDLPRLDTAHFRPQLRDQVQKSLDEARSRPGDPEASGHLGMLLHAYEQYEAAETCYRRARILAPASFNWAYYLALVESLEGKSEEAVVTLRETLRISPDYLPARVKLAEVLVSLNRLRESRDECLLAIKQDPGFVPAYYWLGRTAAAQGDVKSAIEHYRKACELAPAFGSAHYALALLYQKTGDTPHARQSMAAYQKFGRDGDPQPEDPLFDAMRALDNSALAHLMKGVDLEKAGQLGPAIAEHEQALASDAKLAQAHANLIGLYARTGQAEKAEEQYRATVALNPNLPQSHYDFGVLLLSQARYREAEAAFRKALESSPNYAEAHNNLAVLVERQGKFEEAVRHYQAAIDNKPNNREAHFQLGRLLLSRDRNDEAIHQFEQALTPEDARTPRFLYALGAAHAKAGHYSSAAQYLRQAGERAASLGQSHLAQEIEASLRRVEQMGGR